jgi:hypothetical protein
VFFTQEFSIFAPIITITTSASAAISTKIYVFHGGTFYQDGLLVFTAANQFTHHVLAFKRDRQAQCGRPVHSRDASIAGPHYIGQQ